MLQMLIIIEVRFLIRMVVIYSLLVITEKNIILTDFEHDRVVIFNHKGRVKQILSEGLSKPADVTVIDNKLWVLNFEGKYITTYVNE